MSAKETAASVQITTAHVLRHTPRGARTQGREAAMVDIAQNLLLRELHDVGLMHDLAFKGGTALRKLYAGQAGRFSLDLDFSVADIGTNSEDVLALLEEHVDTLQLGPFTYTIENRSGKRHLRMASAELGFPESLSSKLDVSPPPWLAPTTRPWVPTPVHSQYGGPCPICRSSGSRSTWRRRSHGSTGPPRPATCTTCGGSRSTCFAPTSIARSYAGWLCSRYGLTRTG